MIGKVMIGKSFRGCLLYCFQDKLQKEDGQKIVKDRAEVLFYNQCFGNSKELIQQFNEVRMLNQKLNKPVLHITLSLAPGESLAKDKLIEIVEACAKDMSFEANQYVAIVHKDTNHQHLHIVANRVGFNGQTVSDSNSYKKIALFCRKMEIKYNLKQVLSPRRYLTEKERLIPRMDRRKDHLKNTIKQCLKEAKSYGQFEKEINILGYEVIKGRGIAFLDKKGVKVKGSEVGYSLTNIERMLEQNRMMLQQKEPGQNVALTAAIKVDHNFSKIRNERNLKHGVEEAKARNTLGREIHSLLSPIQEQQEVSPELLKKKKKGRRPRL